MSTITDRPVYLDHAATSPLRPEARAAMAPFMEERFGNPASTHAWGRSARVGLEEARERLATTLGARRDEIVFTGSGTEADNIAILGRWRAARQEGARTVACTAIEHRAVLSAVNAAASEGAEPVFLGVDESGRVHTGAIEEALRAAPAVLSVMWGNNEIGTIAPVHEIAERCRAAGICFHSDAVQAFGKVPVRVDEAPVDLLSVSAHKVGGPRGIGALYIREGVRIAPLLYGGGQERGLRPGTVDVASAVGFATAAELAVAEATASGGLRALRDQLESRIAQLAPGVDVIAQTAERLPQTVCVWVPGAEREMLLMALDLENVAVSSGSACQSGSIEVSHVMLAIGRGPGPGAAVRFSLGWNTTAAEVERAAAVFARVAGRLGRKEQSATDGAAATVRAARSTFVKSDG